MAIQREEDNHSGHKFINQWHTYYFCPLPGKLQHIQIYRGHSERANLVHNTVVVVDDVTIYCVVYICDEDRNCRQVGGKSRVLHLPHKIQSIYSSSVCSEMIIVANQGIRNNDNTVQLCREFKVESLDQYKYRIYVEKRG